MSKERALLSLQTTRNLEGMELERAGEIEAAIVLYRANVHDGFEGDWPYGRLVAIYERRGQLDEAIAVLERAIEVFTRSKRRTVADRRSLLAAFKGRLKVVRKAAEAQRKASGGLRPTGV